jgi:transcriptional regulator with XRE-family HTH domain
MTKSKMTSPVSSVIANLARRLRYHRLELGLTQEELAEKAALNPRHIQKLEAGELNVTIGTLVSIALALDVTLTELLEPHLPETTLASTDKIQRTKPEQMLENCRNTDALFSIGLTPETLCHAIADVHMTLDSLDEKLIEVDLPRLGGGTVELANLSSIIGNLLGARIAFHSDGKLYRNRPHTFPDLLTTNGKQEEGIEIKVALEKNKPKGHLAKPGNYLTFRYAMTTSTCFNRNKRGDIAALWEARCGFIAEEDFSLSNTEGDSGKTAVITTTAFHRISLVYFDQTVCPYSLRSNGKPYIGFN